MKHIERYNTEHINVLEMLLLRYLKNDKIMLKVGIGFVEFYKHKRLNNVRLMLYLIEFCQGGNYVR